MIVYGSTLLQPAAVEFTCFSSNECRGNEIPGIGKVENCCISGGGLSFQTTSGQCRNCYGMPCENAMSALISLMHSPGHACM